MSLTTDAAATPAPAPFATPRLARPKPGSLLLPCSIVFFSGFCVMVIELVASRLIAGYIGASLYTWTTVIGVILAGISLGSTIGGRLADKYDTKRLICVLFLLAGALSYSILYVSPAIGEATHSWIYSQGMWTARMLVLVIGAFFLPGAVIGMISPAVVKWALDKGLATGSTVGAVYSWNNVGSILGTFATGFFLLWQFPVNEIVMICSAALAGMGVLFIPAILVDLARGDHTGINPAPRELEPLTAGEEPSLLLPNILVFMSGFCIMMIEMIASRLVAVHIGQSLFTWTSVIGVILAGISVGNRIGGRLADRFETKQLVGSLFLISSILTFSLLQSHLAIGGATSDWLGHEWIDQWVWMDESFTWAARVFLVVFVAFFFPAAALGTISPAVAKWALDRGLATGRTVGAIYAWNTIGSILGTFATGYFLISTFYVSRLIAVSSLVLAIFALAFMFAAGTWLMRLVSFGWMSAAFVAAVFAVMPADRFEDTVLAVFPINREAVKNASEERKATVKRELEQVRLRAAAGFLSRVDEINIWDQYNFRDDFEYYDESNYFTINVGEDTLTTNLLDDYEKGADGKAKTDESGEKIRRKRPLRKLILDALVHGYMDMNDFKYLHYEYEHLYASISHRVLRKHEAAKEPLKVLFLGGGSYTFPRYLSEYYKDIKCDIAEIDPRVTQTVRRSMGMNLVRGKQIYLLAPEPPKASEAPNEKPEDLIPSLTFGEKVGAIVNAFRPTPAAGEIEPIFEKRLTQAGAKRVEILRKGVDYVLDVHPDRQAAASVIDKAKGLGIEVITAAQFDELCDASSHNNIESHHMDARQFIMRSKDQGKYDIIYGDAFNDFSVPAHLTTVEFNQAMASLLKPDGVFMANVIDIYGKSRFMGAYRNTLKKVFDHVYLLATTEGKPDNSRGTFVLMCSRQPIDFSDLGKRDEEKGLVGTLLEGELLKPVIRGGRFPIGRVQHVSDGKQVRFPLPTECVDAGIVFNHTLEPLAPAMYTYADGTITFSPKSGLNDQTALVINKFDDQGRWVGDERARVTLAKPSGKDAAKEGDEKAEKEILGIDAPEETGQATPLTVRGNPKSVTVSFITATNVLADDADYTVENKKELVFKTPPAPGTRLKVTLYGDKEVVLTDLYCPVDNLCGEVAATRAK